MRALYELRHNIQGFILDQPQPMQQERQTALTSSKQIGHLVSLSSFFQSLNVPVGRDEITSSGVAFDRTSPNMLDSDNNASYESSNNSSG